MSEGSLSQEEINALFNQMDEKRTLSIEDFLSAMEQDALGEIGNISLGSSTTALSTLLNQRVEITTPVLSMIEQARMEETIHENKVSVYVDYTTGIRGKNLLMIKEIDAKIIASLMMGGDGTTVEPELSELHLSAVQEAMNQMMGSAATSMSTLFRQKVDISPPTIGVLGFPPKQVENLEDEFLIQVSFQLKVGTLIDSEMIQYIPLSFGKEMIHKLLSSGEEDVSPPTVQKEPIDTIQEASVQPNESMIENQIDPAPAPEPKKPIRTGSVPFITNGAQEQVAADKPASVHQENTNAQKVEYNKFPESAAATTAPANLDLLYDIPLEITVELGRTQLPIRKILELGPGAVIQLEKLAGEPVDILANHKLIAKGEVVVIEESFGVRITDIINQVDRLNKMTTK